MAKTFTNEPVNSPGRHHCRTERGVYLMGPSWIDTTSPSDMMDWDYTASTSELKEAATETHRLWCSQQVAMVNRSAVRGA